MRQECVPFTRARRPVMLWACYACGDRIDETIRFHRLFRREETMEARNERIFRRVQHELEILTLTEVI